MSLQGTRELLDFRPAHARFPPLRLDVYYVQAESILLDDSINSAIAAPSDGLTRIANATAIAHLDEEINDKAFKERR